MFSSCQSDESKNNGLKFDVADLKESLLQEDGTYGYNSAREDFTISIHYFDFLEENEVNDAEKNEKVALIKIGDYRRVNDGEEIIGDILATNYSTPSQVRELLTNLIITAENPPYGLINLGYQFDIGSN